MLLEDRCESGARDSPDTCTRLLYREEERKHDGKQPKEAVFIGGTSLGVRRYAARVVICGASHDARAEDAYEPAKFTVVMMCFFEVIFAALICVVASVVADEVVEPSIEICHAPDISVYANYQYCSICYYYPDKGKPPR